MGQVEQAARFEASSRRLAITVLGGIGVLALIAIWGIAAWALAGVLSAALGLPPLLRLPILAMLGAAIAGLSVGALTGPVVLIGLALSGGVRRRVGASAGAMIKADALGVPEPAAANSRGCPARC